MEHESSVDVFVEIAKKIIREQPIKILVEVGARDCQETLRFRELLPDADIFTFECNPATLPLCRKAIHPFENIHLIEKAVTNYNGFVKFYPIDTEKTETTWEDGNPGVSSLLRASGKYPVEKYVQNEIEIEATTLKTLMDENNISCIDLLWMDVQGAELLVLRGIEDRISDVKLMHIEVEFFEIYKNQPLFPVIKKYLNKKGFLFFDFTTLGKYSADAVFLNKNILQNDVLLLKYKLIDKVRPLKYAFLDRINSLRYNAASFRKKIRRRINILLKLLVFDSRTWHLSVLKRIQPLLKYGHCSSSSIPIDIIVTATEKDLAILPYTVQSVRSNVKHPIVDIFIISPDSDKIKSFCDKTKCKYLNEDTILPITKKDIDYSVKGNDRSGWLFQQLLKLNGDEICSQEYFLVVDADTVFIKPHVFLCKNKTLFSYSDEYHLPYFKAYHKLLGEEPKSCVSFITHHMLFHKTKLNALKRKIENTNSLLWYSAIIDNIDKTEMSAFSEYETYGNFVLSNYPHSTKMEYWFNLSLSRSEIAEISRLAEKTRYKTLSFHSYNQ